MNKLPIKGCYEHQILETELKKGAAILATTGSILSAGFGMAKAGATVFSTYSIGKLNLIINMINLPF